MSIKTEKRILIALALLLFLAKHFLISNLPIHARAYDTDDRLMVLMAAALRGGEWLGDYRGQLLMKGSFFPMFLAGISSLRLDYLGALNFLNALAAFFFVSQLRGILKRPVLRFILFAVLLFDPATCGELSFQRVYRTSITAWEALVLWGVYYGLYVNAAELNGRFRFRDLLLILLAGFDLWAIWNTREECFWVLPFIITATLLIGLRYRQAERQKVCSGRLTVLRAGMLLLPFIMLFAGNQIIRGLNERYYGEAVRLELADGNFSKALKSIYSVKNERETEMVTVTREKLERILAVSPALSRIRPELEKKLDWYARIDRHPKDGNTEDGWFLWGLKYAAFDNGATDTLPKSQNYWEQVHQEIEAALDDPSSGLERQMTMPSPLISPLQTGYLKKLPETLSGTIRFVAAYKDVYPGSGPSGKSYRENDRLFESVTNNTAFTDGEDMQARAAKELPHLDAAVKWLIRIGDVYRAVNPAAAVCGLICFILMAVRLIAARQTEFLPPCLIICGMLFSMLIVAAGVAYTHVSAFSAISSHYLSGAYPLMLGSAWFSILYMIQHILNRKGEQAAGPDGSY